MVDQLDWKTINTTPVPSIFLDIQLLDSQASHLNAQTWLSRRYFICGGKLFFPLISVEQTELGL